jgi:peptide/nickel transport system permease protein
MTQKRCAVRPSLIAGGLIILWFLIVAATAPYIAPPGDGDPTLMARFGFGPVPQPPSREHPLGLMARQYDVFYGLIWGTRMVFRVGLIVTLGRALIGIVLGLIAGHHGGLLDAVLMRITDAFMAFPIIAAAMVALAVFGTDGQSSFGKVVPFLPSHQEQVVIVTLVAFGWMSYARLVRGNVLVERGKEYMQAARATGAPARRIILRHLLPNVTPGLFVLVASDIGAVVVLIIAFTYVGLIPTPGGQMEADWGQMLSAARDWIIGAPSNAFEYWYTYIPPSAAIVLFSMGWNLIGDGLRDLFDPRLR